MMKILLILALLKFLLPTKAEKKKMRRRRQRLQRVGKTVALARSAKAVRTVRTAARPRKKMGLLRKLRLGAKVTTFLLALTAAAALLSKLMAAVKKVKSLLPGKKAE